MAGKKEKYLIQNIYGYSEGDAQVSKKGLYSYDSPPAYTKRPYIRVTLPKNELKLNDLPENIKDIIKVFKFNSINFAQDSEIPEDVINTL